MTSAFAFSAASAAITVTAILCFLAAGNRKDRRYQALRQLSVAASANRTHRDPAARD
jgi:hypothetical protein